MGVDVRRCTTAEPNGIPLLGLLVDIPTRFDASNGTVKADAQAIVDALMSIVLGLESQLSSLSCLRIWSSYIFFDDTGNIYISVPTQIAGQEFFRRIAIVDQPGRARLVSPNIALQVFPVSPAEQAAGLDNIYWKWLFRVEPVSVSMGRTIT